MKKGKITPNGVVLQTHENATVVFLTEKGYDIELVRPSKDKFVKTPDIKMNGCFWEIKSPRNNGKYTIERAIEAASKQADNIIMDLRRSKTPLQNSLKRIKREVEYRKNIKNVLIITKSAKLVDVNKDI